MKFGTRFAMPRRVAKLERLEDGAFCATFENGQRVRGRAVIVATGVQYRRLPIDRLEAFEGAGVYYAATEIEARYCRNAETIIIGGGNSAGRRRCFSVARPGTSACWSAGRRWRPRCRAISRAVWKRTRRSRSSTVPRSACSTGMTASKP